MRWHLRRRADDETSAQVAQLEVENAGDGNLDFDVASDAPWLRIDSALEVLGANAPRTLIISADPTLVRAGTTSSATLTVASRANANDIVVAVALSRGNVFDHTGPEATAVCTGDCNTSGVVTVDELVRAVNIALDRAAVSLCPTVDEDSDGRVTVNEVVGAVNAALRGC